MSKEIAENPQSPEGKSFPSIASSFNTTINNSGDSNNNTYNVTNILNGIFENQEDVTKEETLQFIWEYLSRKDKLNCTLVCKRFNNFISTMNCFCLNNCWTKKAIPILSRDYQRVTIYNYDFNYMDLRMVKFLKHLGRCVNNLKLSYIKVDVMTLIDILDEFPLLKSLELNQLEFEDEKLFLDNLPKFLYLRNLKICNANNLRGVLAIFGSALNIKTLSLRFSCMESNELNKFLNEHRNSLESLRFRCLNISKYIKDSKLDFSSFDHLHQLRKLRLSYCCQLTQNIPTFKCIHWLTDFDVKYYARDKEKVNCFLHNYFVEKEINENQLSEFDASKEPIITKTKCPDTGHVIATYYHVHHCNEIGSHKNCKSIPLKQLELNSINLLFKNLKLNPIRRIRYFFLSILVRERADDFEKGMIKYDSDSD